jgi:hypothetical protein
MTEKVNSAAIQDVPEEGVLKAVSRRNFIKGVISSGVAVSSASYLFRASSMLQGQITIVRCEKILWSYLSRKVGPNFNPEVGFLGRTDCICDYVDVNFKPRPKIRGVRDLNFESFLISCAGHSPRSPDTGVARYLPY